MNYFSVWIRRHSAAFGLALFLLASFGAVPRCHADIDFRPKQEPERRKIERRTTVRFDEQHQFGIRVGAWVHEGEKSPASVDGGSYTFTADYPATNATIEAYYVSHFSDLLGIQLSLGALKRGDVNFSDKVSGYQDYGSLSLYPMTLDLLWYPLSSGVGWLRPFVAGGGSMIVATHSILYSNSYYSVQDRSDFAFGWNAGGGLELAIEPSLALEVAGRYQPVRFTREVLFARNYDAFSITIGGKYFLGSRHPRP